MTARLRAEFETVLETLDRSDVAWLDFASDDRLSIAVEYDVRSLYTVDRGAVAERSGVVGLLFQLHPEHPHVAPLVVARTRHLFNAHISDPESGNTQLPPVPLVCMGPFDPLMRIADWVVAAYDLLRWARISTQRPLNEAAAQFYRRESARPGRFPVDPRSFWRVGEEPAKPGQGPSRESDAKRAVETSSPGVGLRLGSSWRPA